MIIVLLAIILSGIGIGMIIQKKYSDILNPMLAFNGPIFISVVVWCVFFASEHMVSDITLLAYSSGVLFFCVGYIFGSKIVKIPDSAKRVEYHPIRGENKVKKFLLVIGIGSAILNIGYIFKNCFSGPYGSNIFGNLRYMAVFGGSRNTVIVYGIFILSVLVKVNLYNNIVSGRKLKKSILYYFIVMIIDVASTMARTSILSYIIFLVFMLLLKKRIEGKRRRFVLNGTSLGIIVSGMLLLALFYLIAAKTNRLGSGNFWNKDFFIFSYLGKQIECFDEMVLEFAGSGNGLYVFGFFARVLGKLGIAMREYGSCIFNPGGLVFSFIGGPYFDFGIIGVIVSMLIHGVIAAVVYKKNVSCKGEWTVLYGIFIYSYIMAFFDYQFLMSEHIYAVLVLILLKTRCCHGNIVIGKTKIKFQ